MKFINLSEVSQELNRFGRLPSPDIKIYCRNCQGMQMAYRPNEINHISKTSVCAVCGWIYERSSIDKKVKQEVFRIDNHECVYCASTQKLTADHTLPAFYGGSDDPQNLVTACRKCNYRRNNQLDFAPMIYGRFR